MILNMEYHSKLRKFFDEKGISQKEIADKMGYGTVMISKYLRTANPNMEFLNRLVKNYPEIDLNYLFKDDNINLSVNEPDTPEYGENLDLIREMEHTLAKLKVNLTRK